MHNIDLTGKQSNSHTTQSLKCMPVTGTRRLYVRKRFKLRTWSIDIRETSTRWLQASSGFRLVSPDLVYSDVRAWRRPITYWTVMDPDWEPESTCHRGLFTDLQQNAGQCLQMLCFIYIIHLISRLSLPLSLSLILSS